MATVRISAGKFNGIQACASDQGIIAAAAIDQRGSLRQAIAQARGSAVGAMELTEFKTAATQALTPHATAILMDPEYGLEAIRHRAPGTGVLLAYEKSGYDTNAKGRLPDLLDLWSVRRLVEAGAHAIKILLYYNPFDDERINRIKQAFIERVGAECAGLDVPFFLEPLAYDDAIGPEKSLEFARVKPRYVTRLMEEFSQPCYGVDVLKVEVPINAAYVSGMRCFLGGPAAYTRQEALEHFRTAASAATKPFIYLSAGVSAEVFRETLELAIEAGSNFSGVLCGRATWQEGIAVYAQQGLAALEHWMADQGVRNIQLLNEVLVHGAKPWWAIYGGKTRIAVA